jgi:hypothetical protein
MELNHYIKKHRDAYIVNNKLYKNLANYGANYNEFVTMSRNGEYYGITLQLLNRVYPLFNSWHIKQIMININSNYANNYVLIEKFGLHKYYNLYGNDVFKFIVNYFMSLNDLPQVYNDINMSEITNSSDIKPLIKHIDMDCHNLIPVEFILVNCGSLLPNEWLGKKFKNGNDFHRSIDLLECRINKPPVTYLANYNMSIMKKNILIYPFNKICEKSLNVFLHNDFKWKYNLPDNFTNLSIKSEIITLNGKEIKLNLIYEHNNVFMNCNQINHSISYNCSLLQKSIRRGNVNTLKEALMNLRFAKSFNNPELNYKLVTGSRQLIWRLFITIIEDVAIYKSNLQLDIFDLILYTKLCNDISSTTAFTDKFFDKLLTLGELICKSTKIIDFRNFTGKHTFNPLNKTLLGLYIAESEPGMKGDKLMINKLKSVTNYYDLDNAIFQNKIKSNDNFVKLASIDHHCYPQILILLQQIFPDKKVTECCDLIWNESSKLNYRKDKIKNYNEMSNNLKKILLIQYSIKDHFFKSEDYLSFHYKNMLKIDKYLLDLYLSYNNSNYNSDSKNNNLTDKQRLTQQLVFSNTLNGFNYLGKKIYPIYTTIEIKFKMGDKIINVEDPEYNKILTYYQNHITDKCPKDVIKKYNLIKVGNEWTIPRTNIKLSQNDYIVDYISDILNRSNDWINKVLALNKVNYGKSKLFLQNNVLSLINKNDLIRLHGKIITTDTDKNGNDIVILNKIDRLGHSTDSNVDDYQGTIKTLFDILCLIYPCFIKINNFKYKINKLCSSYDNYLANYHQIISSMSDNKISTMNIKTDLWSHQDYISKNIMNLMVNYGVTGFGDASQVGSGKTLTALNVMKCVSKLPGSLLNYLILVPNTNLFKVWIDEVIKHTSGCNVYVQNQNGNYELNSVNSNNTVTIYVTTMSRNRDYFDEFNVPIDLVIIDECLTVQNKETKWTIKAFMSVSKAKYGVLMLSATFFRTRFDKLLFMLKMLNTGLPERQEYLDTILNTAINLNININKRIWKNNIIRINLPDDKKLEYDKMTLINDKKLEYDKMTLINDNKLKYIKCKDVINGLNWTHILLTISRHLVSQNKKVLCYVDSQNDIDYLKQQNNDDVYIYDLNNNDVINKNICVISKYKGTYGINNLVSYDTIVLRPVESDKIPQIKGRLDRPGQKAKSLEINFVIINGSIEELDITKIDIANNFYNNHILPLKIN